MKVKVRIAVAVDNTGDWHAAGWRYHSNNWIMDHAKDQVQLGATGFWLEAVLDVPKPVAKAVKAKVIKAK